HAGAAALLPLRSSSDERRGGRGQKRRAAGKRHGDLLNADSLDLPPPCRLRGVKAALGMRATLEAGRPEGDSMKTGDLCKRSVVTALPEATLCDVARLMRGNHVGSVVIVDGAGKPVGIVTDRDIVIEV